jgi:prevent-host-death family protein
VEVGVRELKNNLSRYLAQVSTGKEVIITDRGRAVARITPIGTERNIDKLIAQGVVTPASTAKQVAPIKRVLTKKPVSSLVADQRR